MSLVILLFLLVLLPGTTTTTAVALALALAATTTTYYTLYDRTYECLLQIAIPSPALYSLTDCRMDALGVQLEQEKVSPPPTHKVCTDAIAHTCSHTAMHVQMHGDTHTHAWEHTHRHACMHACVYPWVACRVTCLVVGWLAVTFQITYCNTCDMVYRDVWCYIASG